MARIGQKNIKIFIKDPKGKQYKKMFDLLEEMLKEQRENLLNVNEPRLYHEYLGSIELLEDLLREVEPLVRLENKK